MNEQIALAIAEAVRANSRVLEMLMLHFPVQSAPAAPEPVVAEKPIRKVKDSPPVLAPATIEHPVVAPVQQIVQPVAPVQQIAPAPVVAAPVVPPTPAPTAPAPVVNTPAPVVAAPATPAPVSPSECVITDQQSLNKYVMAKYRELGPIKGAEIQTVLVALGCANVNQVKPEQYADFFQRVEAIGK